MSKIVASNLIFAVVFQVFLMVMASVAMLTIFLLTDQTITQETLTNLKEIPFIP